MATEAQKVEVLLELLERSGFLAPEDVAELRRATRVTIKEVSRVLETKALVDEPFRQIGIRDAYLQAGITGDDLGEFPEGGILNIIFETFFGGGPTTVTKQDNINPTTFEAQTRVADAVNRIEAIHGRLFSAVLDPDVVAAMRAAPNSGAAMQLYQRFMRFMPEESQAKARAVQDAWVEEGLTGVRGESIVEGFLANIDEGSGLTRPIIGFPGLDEEVVQELYGQRPGRADLSPLPRYLQGDAGPGGVRFTTATLTPFEQPVLRYRQDDEIQIPGGMSIPRLEQLKEDLVKAGYLHPDLVRGGGAMDQNFYNAVADLLFDSNAIGSTWETQLTFAVFNPSQTTRDRLNPPAPQRASLAPFAAPAYLAPDMDALKQAVKDSVRRKLRREPTDTEMRALTAGLDAEYRQEFDVQVAAARAEHAGRVAANETDEAQGVAGTFRTVDPTAGFAEQFEQRFSGELDIIKRSDDLQERQVRVGQAMSRFDALIGG